MAEEANPFRGALRLLEGSVHSIGPHDGRDVHLGLLSGMLPLDRDILLVHLSRITFGAVRYQTARCPFESCGSKLDLQYDLSSLEADPPGHLGPVRIEAPDGRHATLRLPTAGDQAAVHGTSPELRPRRLVERCLVDDSEVDAAALERLDDALVERLSAGLLGASPSLDSTLTVRCPECERPFEFQYDPVLSLTSELRAARGALLKEVHHLAYHYHWGLGEILELPRSLRREYLELLDDELRHNKSFLGVLS